MFLCVVLVGHVVICELTLKKGGALPRDILVGAVLCDSHPSCWVLCPSRIKIVFVLPDSVTSVVSGPYISIFW